MPEELFELLRKILIFSKLDSDSLGAIVPLFKKMTYHQGDVLFRENTFGDKLYIIIDGEVEITKREKIGEETTRLALRRKGDIFGEMSLLDEEPRFASAKAAKETQVLELSKSNFLTMLSDNPLVAYQIIRVLSSRLRQSDLHMIDELRKKNKQLSKAYDNLKSYAEALTQSHQELNQSKSFLERIISTSPYSIVVTGLDGTISLFNKTARREYRYDSEEVIGKEIKMLRGGANLLNLDELIEESLKREGIWQGEIIARKKDGTHFVADTIICSVKDRMGQTSAILHISKDVTFEKNLNLQALELERMATRGEMAAEVAHELNNYLQIVRGNLDLLSYDIKNDPENRMEKRMSKMKCELEKIGGFVSNLMDFAIPQSMKKPLDLINFFEKELFFLRPQNRFDDIEFKSHFDRKLPLVEVDFGQLQQLFYNLMNNAADALKMVSGRKKVIEITVRYLSQDKQVEMEVKDNGIGMGKEEQIKAFKERFTTKEKGHGFGLLSVRRAVESHQGSIQVQSEERSGTKFIVRIPTKQPEPTQGERSPIKRQPAHQKG